MAADFSKPVTTDGYVELLAMLRDNHEVLARMFASGTVASNIPTGAVRFDSGKFQTWSGAAWVDVPVSLDGGGTGAQSAAAAREALGANDAANLTTGVMSADRVPGLDASKLISGTLTLDTTGNADSAGSAPWSGISDKPAVIAAGATQQDARAAIGASNGQDMGSRSSSSSTGSVTTTHYKQVNASYACTASGDWSQVNASYTCTASGDGSQVNASVSCTASGSYSQVNTSSASTASGYWSQVNASSASTASGYFSQVNASARVSNTTDYSLALGYGSSGGASTANQKIRLEAQTGIGRFMGNTTTGGFDYAEYFPNLNNGAIPDGTIVTLVNEKVTTAKAGDFILGTVSATAGVIGNAPEFCWSGRFLKDEFGRELKQEADFVRWQSENDIYDGLVSECDKPIPSDAAYYKRDIPVTNPDYVDISGDYAPRGDRKDEWSVVGLMGQVYVRVYADIPNNTFVSAGGLQSTDETNLYCMTMTTPFSSEKGYGVAFCLLR